MTATSRARRNAADVEVMRLSSIRHMSEARAWMASEAVDSELDGYVLRIHCPDGMTLARLGQWLTFDPETREFAVLTDAVYRATHTEAMGVGQ